MMCCALTPSEAALWCEAQHESSGPVRARDATRTHPAKTETAARAALRGGARVSYVREMLTKVNIFRTWAGIPPKCSRM